jgi:hypothetical protein
LLLGARLYFSFHTDAVGTQAEFLKQVDLVERELGQRGKAPAEEGVPPAPVPVPLLASVSSRAPPPTAPRSEQALEPTDHEQASFTSSMRVASNGCQETIGTDEIPLLQLLLEREQKLREDSKAELHQQIDKLRAELMPVEAVSTEQLHSLQSRLDAMHGAELLSDAELHSLENLVAASLFHPLYT